MRKRPLHPDKLIAVRKLVKTYPGVKSNYKLGGGKQRNQSVRAFDAVEPTYETPQHPAGAIKRGLIEPSYRSPFAEEGDVTANLTPVRPKKPGAGSLLEKLAFKLHQQRKGRIIG